MARKTLEERLWVKVAKTNGCWDWTGGKSDNGYGSIGVGGIGRQAHRIAYQLAVGPIPDGMFIDHICHNRGCVKPEHLRLATNKQNLENLGGVNSNNITSGVRGVYKNGSGWQARTKHNGKIHTAGTHRTIEEAEAAVIALRNRLFSHNNLDRAA